MAELDRRDALKLIAAGGASAIVVACARPRGRGDGPDPVIAVQTLPPAPAPWPTLDPFLFCVHHDDHYPAGNDGFGPAAPLAGRQLGSDFGGLDGWSMYHGETVPGFPQHPHRGFETVTVVRRGLLDHADSMGAAARYGGGDVQWLTAGAGILHAEMFPLLQRSGANPLELCVGREAACAARSPTRSRAVLPRSKPDGRAAMGRYGMTTERPGTTRVPDHQGPPGSPAPTRSPSAPLPAPPLADRRWIRSMSRLTGRPAGSSPTTRWAGGRRATA